MNFTSLLLAQAAPSGGFGSPVGPDGSPIVKPEQAVPPAFFESVPTDDIWRVITQISWIQAVVCVAFALIYLIYGWRVFKVLVVINIAVLGLVVGRFLGAKLNSPIWGGIIGTIVMATITWPFMKYCVSGLGALAGAVLGAAIWQTAILPEPLVWVGALAGLVAGGFMAFSSFKFSIMLFTSLQGSVFLAIGLLALLNDYPRLSSYLAVIVYSHGYFLSLAVVIPTVFSILLQRKLLSKQPNWAMPE